MYESMKWFFFKPLFHFYYQITYYVDFNHDKSQKPPIPPPPPIFLKLR